MAKKKTALGAFEGLGNINLSGLTPSLNTKPFYPEVNHPDLLGIKPLGEQFVEALVPIQAELTRVTGELTKANERAGLAEERATVAESKTRRANIITLFISILAIAIPLIQGWYNDPKNQVKEQRLEKLSSIVEQQGLQIKILEGEVSKPKTLPLPVKNPSGSSKATGSKKS